MADEKNETPAPKSTELSDLPSPDAEGVRGGALVEPCWRPRTIVPCIKPGDVQPCFRR